MFNYPVAVECTRKRRWIDRNILFPMAYPTLNCHYS